MTVTLDLASLQDIDNELGRVRAELADIEAKIGPDPELDAVRETIVTLDDELVSVARREKELDDEAESIGEKVLVEEGRLYEGSVKLPKELAGLQQEIASLRSRKSVTEDGALDLLEQSSDLEAKRAEAVATEARLDAAWQSGQRAFEAQVSGLREEEEELLQKRHSQTDAIDAGTLDLYEDLRRRKAGIAVSTMNSAICGGCRIAMPEAVRRRVMTDRGLPQCPNCERILVVR